jgi:SAM-dependent methyltransferase
MDRLRVKELERAFLNQAPPARSAVEPTDAHRRFGNYALRFLAPGQRVLDVGCGEGSMVRFLSGAGLVAHGVDVRPFATRYYREVARERECFAIGSGTALPYADGSFDAVTFFDVLEHVYEVEQLLSEACRVLARGGKLIVVSPNLLSPVHSLSSLWSSVKGEEGFHLFRHRDPPTSPFGNTVLQILWILLRNAILMGSKLVVSRSSPSFRVPDPRYVGWGDSDSIYLVNPVEVRRWFRKLGLAILAYQGEGTTGALGPLAGGVWIVGCKGSPDRGT